MLKLSKYRNTMIKIKNDALAFKEDWISTLSLTEGNHIRLLLTISIHYQVNTVTRTNKYLSLLLSIY